MNTLSLSTIGTLALACAMPACAQTPSPDSAAPELFDVVPVQGNIYMIPGAGGNVTLQVGDEGIIVVDTGTAENAERLLATIRHFSDQPIRHVINTHLHPDHTGGNAVISQAGQQISYLEQDLPGAGIYAHENVLGRMAAAEDDYPPANWPYETYYTDRMELYMNGESVQILNPGNATTDGDSMVYFRSSDVIASGDVYLTTYYPFIDVENGGTVQGVLDALNQLIALMVPSTNEEGGTLVVSGHGRISDEYEVVVYRDMLTIIRDRIADMIGKGMSLDDVKAARPTRDYDGRWGLDRSWWSTERFIEAIYNELAEPQGS